MTSRKKIVQKDKVRKKKRATKSAFKMEMLLEMARQARLMDNNPPGIRIRLVDIQDPTKLDVYGVDPQSGKGKITQAYWKVGV